MAHRIAAQSQPIAPARAAVKCADAPQMPLFQGLATRTPRIALACRPGTFGTSCGDKRSSCRQQPSRTSVILGAQLNPVRRAAVARVRKLRPDRFPSVDLAIGYYRNKVRLPSSMRPRSSASSAPPSGLFMSCATPPLLHPTVNDGRAMGGFSLHRPPYHCEDGGLHCHGW